MRFMPNVVNVFVLLNLNLFNLSQKFGVQMIFNGRVVPLPHVQTAQLLLRHFIHTLMKLDSRSSAIIVRERSFEPNL